MSATPRATRPPRAGILVTGTEVLTGIIADRNGPWLSERLREIGVDAAMIQIVGDRPHDLLAALEFFKAQGMALVVTSGGLGPTADDLTAEIVGRFCGREMVLDGALEAAIAEILSSMLKRWPGLDPEAIGRSLAAHDGVVEVHDLHVWEVTSGFPALSAHVLVQPEADCHAARLRLSALLAERFKIEHTTLQVDHAAGELLEIQPAPGRPAESA